LDVLIPEIILAFLLACSYSHKRTIMRNRDPNSPSRRPRMNAGELAVFVERFTDHLTSLGHSRLTVTGLSDSARHFADWLCRAGITAGDIDDCVLDEFAHHRCQCPGGRRGRLVSPSYLRRVRRFVRFLGESGVTASSSPVGATAAEDPRVTEFLAWLRCHRGISGGYPSGLRVFVDM
jgi:integrase/recombinase XerD